VEGDLTAATDVSDQIADLPIAEDDPRVVFVGVSIDTVQDEPIDQVMT
jgi:hypothetical protein